MSASQLEAMLALSQARAEAYVHAAKIIVMNQFGPAAEHTHTEITVALASAMMQHEGAQIIADAYRSAGGKA
ncbi:hypothetical protein OEW28_09575 [Defluviimonas sp. WL0002]|uniref:Uncharacterized protein n=1 Tax=Albidovulum marisflavi TaxID=2984159 RepID=A0ABT2ZCR3_9RHOB|nr:hypothetical protein [Defluviimonas sp. WL0002]MCV2868877.1 hypothetical protein [Defluviimonas sp. WL0002]